MSARTIAIGDIHGCAAALDSLLAAIRPASEDCIVTLGDYINRGPDSRSVIARLIELKNFCHLVPLLGNHEEMLFEALANQRSFSFFLRVGGDATLDSYGPGRLLTLIPDDHFDFFKSCVDYHETETHIFVHASYAPHLAMAEQKSSVLRWDSLRCTIPERHISGKTVIAGHTSQKHGEILDVGHLKAIDTFCYGGAWLTALDVDTQEVWQTDRDGNVRGP